MKNLKENIISLMKEFNEIESKKLQIQQLLNLINKLEEHNINDEKLFVKFEELISNLRSIKNGDNGLKRGYKKSYYKLKQTIQKQYGIVEKGTYIKMGLAIGMTFGISIGAAFTLSRSMSVSFGMIAGIIIGITIGSLKEKNIENEDKLY